MTFQLLDGARIPWLGWGNGTGSAQTGFSEVGALVLESGIRHIDTAQAYGDDEQEDATGRLLASTAVPLDEIWLTSKWSKINKYSTPCPLSLLKPRIRESVKKLHKTPDLYLIHSPYVAEDGTGNPEHLKNAWKQFEELKDEGTLKSIGVSNFRPQDLKAILEIAKYKPVVNQMEYHPYVLTHLDPVIKLQEEHGIITQAYGPLTPYIRNKAGPLTPILERIADRLGKDTGKAVDPTHVLILWTKAKGAVVVTASGQPDRIKGIAATTSLPDLTPEEVEEIERVGRTVHFRHYSELMAHDFPEPDLPSQ